MLLGYQVLKQKQAPPKLVFRDLDPLEDVKQVYTIFCGFKFTDFLVYQSFS